MKVWQATLFPLFFATCALGQTLESVLIDSTTGSPVADAFVFFSNTSTGTISSQDGIFTLPFKNGTDVFLVVSHINYQTLTLAIPEDKKVPDTIYLASNSLLLAEVVVGKKAVPRIRRQRENAFIRAFIGSQRAKITLINPQVLLFWENEDTLIAQADQPLVIRNELLGYSVTYFLDDFRLHPNGDVQFEGNAFFEELESSGKEMAQFKRNRLRAYQNSPQYVFDHLITGQLDSSVYKIGFSRRLADQSFELYDLLNPSDLIVDSILNTTTIQCKGYFTVVNKGIRVSSSSQKAKLPTASFGEVKQTPISYETSYLHPKTNRIILDKNGAILNQKDIEEYGYWATIRTSSLLPNDYATTPPNQ